MKNLAEVFGFIVFVAVAWHVKVFFSDKTQITGLFEVSPKIGYVWTNDYTYNARAFWGDTKVRWHAGEAHPKYNVVSANAEGSWVPKAGYEFANTDNNDLSTSWKEGLKHPAMKAYSTSIEGEWRPQLGYKFQLDVYGNAKNTLWDAGRVYSERKIKASDVVDQFNALPGYSFPNPDESLDVVWTPGLTHPDKPGQIASGTEGVWNDAYADNTYMADASSEGVNQMGGGVLLGLFASVAEWAVGKNDFTDAMKEEAAKEVIKGGIKTFSN